MQTTADVLNAPFTIRLAGQDYKARKVSIGDLYMEAEKVVRDRRLALVQQVAAGLTGRDKVEYLIGATRDLVKNDGVGEALREYLNTAESSAKLIRAAFAKDQPTFTESDAMRLMGEDPDGARLLIGMLAPVTEENGKGENPPQTLTTPK